MTPPSFSGPSPTTGHDILMFYRQRSDFDHCCPCLSTATGSWQSVKLNVKTEEKHCISDLGYNRLSDFSSCHSLRYKPPREVARFIQIDHLFLISWRPAWCEIYLSRNNKHISICRSGGSVVNQGGGITDLSSGLSYSMGPRGLPGLRSRHLLPVLSSEQQQQQQQQQQPE